MGSPGGGPHKAYSRVGGLTVTVAWGWRWRGGRCLTCFCPYGKPVHPLYGVIRDPVRGRVIRDPVRGRVIRDPVRGRVIRGPVRGRVIRSSAGGGGSCSWFCLYHLGAVFCVNR